MTEDSIRVTAGRPVRGTKGATGSPARRGRGLPVPSEALVLGLLVLALLIAAAVADNFQAPLVWGFITILGAAYILARGLVKRGHGEDGL